MELKISKIGVAPGDQPGAVVFGDTSGDSLHPTGPLMTALLHLEVCSSKAPVLATTFMPGGAVLLVCPVCLSSTTFNKAQLREVLDHIIKHGEGYTAQIGTPEAGVMFVPV